MIENVVIIGAGNLATQLALALNRQRDPGKAGFQPHS